MIIRFLFWSIIGFFSGSVLYSYLLPKLLYKKDITKISKDGNPGCGNVFTCINIPCGILCLVLELMKGAIPIWLASNALPFDNPLFALVLAAPVAGHAFSPILKNKGGKSIAVSFGVFIGMLPKALLLFYLAIPFVFFSTIVRICPHSVRVMVSFTSMFICSLLFEPTAMAALAAAIITVIVINKHYSDFVVREKKEADIYILFYHLHHHNAVINANEDAIEKQHL